MLFINHRSQKNTSRAYAISRTTPKKIVTDILMGHEKDLRLIFQTVFADLNQLTTDSIPENIVVLIWISMQCLRP